MLQTSTTLENHCQLKTTITLFSKTNLLPTENGRHSRNYTQKTAFFFGLIAQINSLIIPDSKLATENGLFFWIYGSNKLTDFPRFHRDAINSTQYGAYKLNQEKQTPHYYTKTQSIAETRFNRTLHTARRKASALLCARRNV